MNISLHENWQDIFECFSSPTRIDILRLLSQSPLNISELADKLYISPPVITRHIARLEAAGLVTTYRIPGKRGNRKICVLCEQQLNIQFICDNLPCRSQPYLSLPLGAFCDVNIAAPCGFLNADQTLHTFDDDASAFNNRECFYAVELWFSSGSLCYRLPQKPIPPFQELELFLRVGCYTTTAAADTADVTVTLYCGNKIIGSIHPEITAVSSLTYPDATYKSYILRITDNGTWLDNTKLSTFSVSDFAGSDTFILSVSTNTAGSICRFIENMGSGFLFRTIEFKN